jgi:hydroxymethylpyrimidine pyrophosphatase-like HAD family hydrolase
MKTDFYFDIDGCLLTPEYRTAVDKEVLEGAVSIAGSRGASFHLNSNRSLESIIKVRRAVGFDGRIIFENGTGIWDPVEGTKPSGFRPLDRRQLLMDIEDYGFECMFIDTDRYAEEAVRKRSGCVLPRRIAFCEKTRLYTSSIYPLRLPGNSKADPDDLDGLAAHLSRRYWDSYRITRNDVYMNLLMVPVLAEKGRQMSGSGEGSVVAAFGDEISDISMFRKSDICGCPANAVDDVKKEVVLRGGFIAPSPYTAGVCEFISYVLENGQENKTRSDIQLCG